MTFGKKYLDDEYKGKINSNFILRGLPPFVNVEEPLSQGESSFRTPNVGVHDYFDQDLLYVLSGVFDE